MPAAACFGYGGYKTSFSTAECSRCLKTLTIQRLFLRDTASFGEPGSRSSTTDGGKRLYLGIAGIIAEVGISHMA
jgi:hypothetical protein